MVPNDGRPGFPVRPHPGVVVSHDEEGFLVGHAVDGGVKGIIELVLLVFLSAMEHSVGA